MSRLYPTREDRLPPADAALRMLAAMAASRALHLEAMRRCRAAGPIERASPLVSFPYPGLPGPEERQR